MNKELWDSQRARSGDQKERRKGKGKGEGMPVWAEGKEGEGRQKGERGKKGNREEGKEREHRWAFTLTQKQYIQREKRGVRKEN